MRKLRGPFFNIAVAIVATLLTASPSFVLAQSTGAGANTSYTATVQQLVAVYTQLVQLLEQEIASLTGNPQPIQLNMPPAPATSKFTATPTSGSAPLTVTFSAVRRQSF
jgi:PKD repeat protein